MTDRELVCSRARRDSEGRLNGVSPLFPRDIDEVYLAQSREPEHAASASDRLLARPKEFGQFIGEGIRLIQVTVGSMGEVEKSLDFFMGKNTPERRDFIIENLATDVLTGVAR